MQDRRSKPEPKADRLVTALTLIIQVWLGAGLILFFIRRDWENVFLTLTVIGLIVVPAFLLRRIRVHVPPDFHLLRQLSFS